MEFETLEFCPQWHELFYFKELLDNLEKSEKINIQKSYSNECKMIIALNDNTDIMIEALKKTKTALANMMDRRNAIAKRLKNPFSQTTFLLEYKIHEDFLKYCSEMPHILGLLKNKKNSERFAAVEDEDSKLISSLEMEIKLQKLFICCMNRFLSDLAEYETHVLRLTDFLRINEDDDKSI